MKCTHFASYADHNTPYIISDNRSGSINFRTLGPPTTFWKCRGQKSFGCLGELQKSKFLGKNP